MLVFRLYDKDGNQIAWKCGSKCPSNRSRILNGKEMIVSEEANDFLIESTILDPMKEVPDEFIDKERLKKEGLPYIATLKDQELIKASVLMMAECFTLVTGIPNISNAIAALMYFENQFQIRGVDDLIRKMELMGFIQEKMGIISSVGWNAKMSTRLSEIEKSHIEEIATSLHLMISSLRDENVIEVSTREEDEKLETFQSFLSKLNISL